MDRSGAADSDHWQTPQWLYDELDAEFHFDFDPGPIHANFDGLSIEWGQSNFINPPYNRTDKPKFIKKAFDEWKKGKTCVLLIPAATSTGQFHEVIKPNAEVRFQRGRIVFIPPEYPRNISLKDLRKNVKEKYGKKKSVVGKHDSMIVIFRGNPHTEGDV